MARGSIFVRTNKGGKKRYCAIIKVNGHQRWKTFSRKKAAEEFLDRNSTDIREGTYREIKKARFEDYITIWKESHLNEKLLKPSTINSYGSNISKYLLPEFSEYQMTAIGTDELDRFQSKLLTNLSNKSTRNIMRIFGKILEDARKANYLKITPKPSIALPRMHNKKTGRALKPDEVQAILEKCGPRLRLIFLTAVLTGMRRGELFGLPWENIDWENDVIKVRRALFWKYGKYQTLGEDEPRYAFVTPKSKQSIREIDMSPMLKKELRKLYLRSPKKGLVFCASDSRPLDPDSFRDEFRDTLKAAKIQGNTRWHDLRHTYGSLKIDQGENIYYVMRQMGHSSIQVTIDVYGHLLKDRKPEAAEKTDAVIFGEK